MRHKEQKWNERETLENATKYFAKNFMEAKPHHRPFIHLNGDISCGWCGKRMGFLRSFFHGHLYKTE